MVIKEQIIIFKATSSTVDSVIRHQIYASAYKPNKERIFKKFLLIGDTDVLGTRVYAMGDVDSNIKRISPTSKVLSVFDSTNNGKWEWEFSLSNIIDLRANHLTIEEVFLPQDVEKIVRYTQQFTYVNHLNPIIQNIKI